MMENKATENTNLCKYCNEYVSKPEIVCRDCEKFVKIIKLVIKEVQDEK